MVDFDFQRYVDRQKDRQGIAVDPNRPEYGDYAFAGDLRVLRRLNKMKPVSVVAEASARLWKSVHRKELLASSEKVTRRQFPEVYDATVDCAHLLDIPMPTVYISRDSSVGAGTFGSHDDDFIILSSSLVQMLEPAELKFVLGHQCGHLQNGHVLYQTAVTFMGRGVGVYVKWAVGPATMALKAWSRRGEVTCDRAGLVCCKSEQDAMSAIIKLATGSSELGEQVNIQDYLSQLDAMQEGVGRFGELFSSHPFLPKRLRAMQLFAASTYYRALIGERGGRPLDEIDEEVEELLKVM